MQRSISSFFGAKPAGGSDKAKENATPSPSAGSKRKRAEEEQNSSSNDKSSSDSTQDPTASTATAMETSNDGTNVTGIETSGEKGANSSTDAKPSVNDSEPPPSTKKLRRGRGPVTPVEAENSVDTSEKNESSDVIMNDAVADDKEREKEHGEKGQEAKSTELVATNKEPTNKDQEEAAPAPKMRMMSLATAAAPTKAESKGPVGAAKLLADRANDEKANDDDDDDDDDDDESSKAATLSLSAPSSSSIPGVSPSSSKSKSSSGKEKLSFSSRSKYHPIDDASWQAGKPVPYAALAAMFGEVEEVSSRILTVAAVRSLIQSVMTLTPEDLVPVIYLCVGKIAPAYAGLELGIGDGLLTKALSEATGRTVARLKEEYDEAGDLGIVALSARVNQRTLFAPKALTARGVFKALQEIATTSGHGKKKDKIKSLLVACREKEAQYIIRCLQGKLRIGLQEASVLQALAHAVVMNPPKGTPPFVVESGALNEVPSKVDRLDVTCKMTDEKRGEVFAQAEAVIKSVYSEMPNYDKMLGTLLEKGLAALPEHCFLTPGVPVKPMLAKPTKGIGEVLDRFGKTGAFTSEYKYDGERAQVHLKEDGTIEIYSRNSEDMTQKYPDLVQMIPKVIKKNESGENLIKSFIIDTEAVAVDRTAGKILPFQSIQTRARKDVSIESIKVNVCLFAFDALYINGESLVKKTFRERRDALWKHFEPLDLEFAFATYADATDTEAIQAFLNSAVEDSCEGLMVKTLDEDASYEPSRRSLNWLKIKKDYLDGMTDTVDLVPIGGYYGKGKRTGVYGGFLLASWNDEEEVWESVCKVATGFSESDLAEAAEELNKHKIEAATRDYLFGESVRPDVWFKPAIVWEILAADLSVSPVHMSGVGIVDESRGIALRFPRFQHRRMDKNPEDATTSTQIADMYRNQASISSNATGGGYDDDY